MTKPSSKSHRELTPRAPGRRAAPVVRQVLWASVPVWSFGFLSFVPFLAYAIMRRRKADWAVFAAYLAATIGLIVAAGTVGSGNGGGTAAFGGFIIALAGCAAVHAAIVFRPGSAPAAPVAASGRRPARGSTTRTPSPRQRTGLSAGRRRGGWPRPTPRWRGTCTSAGPMCRGTTTTAGWWTSTTCLAPCSPPNWASRRTR